MTYRTEYRCSACSQALTYHQVMYSDGRCPRCGVKHPSAHSIVDTVEWAYKLKRRYPWWMVWKSDRTYREYKI